MKHFKPGDLVRYNPKYFSIDFPLLTCRPESQKGYVDSSSSPCGVFVVLGSLSQNDLDDLPEHADKVSPAYWCLDSVGIAVISVLSLIGA